jgi:hypothetical protein
MKQIAKTNMLQIGNSITQSKQKRQINPHFPRNPRDIRSGFLLFTPLEELKMQHHSPVNERETLYNNKVVQFWELLGGRFGGAEPQLPRKISGVGYGQSGGLFGAV